MYKTALELLKQINSNGYKAYIVGGYPRDLYLNRESSFIHPNLQEKRDLSLLV